MQGCVSFKSEVIFNEEIIPKFHRYHTSTDLSPQVDPNPHKLLSVLGSLLCGQKNIYQAFGCPSTQPTLKRKTSIENLQIFLNEPQPEPCASMTVFSSQFSAFNLDCGASSLGSRLSTYSMAAEVDLLEFECGCELHEQDIRRIFCNGDYKVMISSIALMCKFLYLTGHRLTLRNVFAIFGASAIITFKMAYDEDLPGIIREFSDRMGVSPEKLRRLEDLFLRAIQFDLNITGKAMNTVMIWFV